jgi:prolyl oligopeptidase
MISARLLAAAAITLALTAPAAIARDMSEPQYPPSRKGDVVEEQFGEAIADPWRWLENDVRNDQEVADWVEAQNALTNGVLEQMPARGWFKQRLGQLYDIERFSTPVRAGSGYFYTRNTGLQNQSPLYVRDSLDGEGRLLIDPNAWASDGATALSDWRPSDDGSLLLYSVQDGGSDWRVLRVLDVTTGAVLADEIRWAKFTDLAWVGNEGFLYSRFPEPEEGQDFQALNYDQAVYYHRLGTPQSEDQLVYATPGNRELMHTASVSSDGRWAIVTSASGTDARYELHAIPLDSQVPAGYSGWVAGGAENWGALPLVKGFENNWMLVDAMGESLWFVTNRDAGRMKVVRADLDLSAAAGTPPWRFTEIVPEAEEPIAVAAIIGDTLVLSYMRHAASLVKLFTPEGRFIRDLELPGIGSVGGFSGEPGNPESFYSFTSFNRPSTIFRLDMASGASSTFAAPELAFDPDDFTVEQHFYASKDGTKVPMFIVRKADLAATGQPAPTLLYGYGGFDVSLTPGYSVSRMAWMEAGGVFALANIRGGGEYGKAWHDGGRLANKQNVFDDFIAAGEYLKAQGFTPADGLAIQGGSNGGLLVGAVINQRPDLFAAGNAAVGVMDMLRFDRFTAGRYWVDDYGYPSKEADFRVLRAYSPYHNIRDGVDYPAILVTTADTDDRVVPGHSFKYTAALQAAELGSKPHVIRIETRAGHGSGKPTDKAIEEAADILSFLGHYTGLVAPK